MVVGGHSHVMMAKSEMPRIMGLLHLYLGTSSFQEWCKNVTSETEII